MAPSHSRRDHRHSHPQNNSILLNQFDSFPSDIFGDFRNDGFSSSFSAYNSAFSNGHGGGGGGGGAIKRTSTSTTFVNGKKLTTKK